MAKKFKRYLVTSALPYANGPVHIGHLAGGLHPVRHLHARICAAAGATCCRSAAATSTAWRSRSRRARRGFAQGDHRPLPQPHQAFVRTARHVILDIYSRTSSPVHAQTASDFFRKLYAEGQVRREDLRAVLRRGGAAVSGRPLHRSTCPHCQNEKGLRRPVREVRVDAFARRTDRTPTARCPVRRSSSARPSTGTCRLDKYEGFLREWIPRKGTRSGVPTSTGSARAGSIWDCSRVP